MNVHTNLDLTDIFVKDTFLVVFVQKSGRTVTFLYEIGYFMGIYENT